MQAADHIHRYLTLDECFLKETAKESEEGAWPYKINARHKVTTESSFNCRNSCNLQL